MLPLILSALNDTLLDARAVWHLRHQLGSTWGFFAFFFFLYCTISPGFHRGISVFKTDFVDHSMHSQGLKTKTPKFKYLSSFNQEKTWLSNSNSTPNYAIAGRCPLALPLPPVPHQVPHYLTLNCPPPTDFSPLSPHHLPSHTTTALHRFHHHTGEGD